MPVDERGYYLEIPIDCVELPDGSHEFTPYKLKKSRFSVAVPDPERELFEKWIAARYPDQPIMIQRATARMRHDVGQEVSQTRDYACDATQFAWEAWNEALK